MTIVSDRSGRFGRLTDDFGWMNMQLPVTTIREIKVLKCLNHPNLVELKEVVVSAENEDDDGNSEQNSNDGRRYRRPDLTLVDCCCGCCVAAEFTEKDEPLDYCHGSIYLVLEYVEHDLTGLIDRQYPYVGCHLERPCCGYKEAAYHARCCCGARWVGSRTWRSSAS